MIRDIANVMLMLILFVIALGIMLRRSEFKNYQALIYLVAVAILLNFSLVICGVLIDISNYFTLFFLHNGGIQNLECNLVMTIQRVSNIFNQGSST
jgi:multisubunit Na+/H+ antiporter MnhB subunit